MSVNYSAELVYGVRLEVEELYQISERPDYDNIYDKWIVAASLYDNNSDHIVGIIMDGIDEGESTEVCLSNPTGRQFDELLDILDELGINREPIWHLICQVS